MTRVPGPKAGHTGQTTHYMQPLGFGNRPSMCKMRCVTYALLIHVITLGQALDDKLATGKHCNPVPPATWSNSPATKPENPLALTGSGRVDRHPGRIKTTPACKECMHLGSCAHLSTRYPAALQRSPYRIKAKGENPDRKTKDMWHPDPKGGGLGELHYSSGRPMRLLGLWSRLGFSLPAHTSPWSGEDCIGNWQTPVQSHFLPAKLI